MNGPDLRPEVRIAYINADGTIDTTGQEAFGYFEILPSVGDVLVEPAIMDGSPEAVAVVGRQFIRPDGEEPRWWLIVRPLKDGRQWRDVCQLDNETNQAFAEMRQEASADFEKMMHDEHLENQRARQEESSARKALAPKGRQPRPRKRTSRET